VPGRLLQMHRHACRGPHMQREFDQCSEGTLGCPYGSSVTVGGVACTAGSEETCPADCFKCTVTPAEGHTCSESSINVHCKKDGASIMPSSQTGGWLCVNNGMGADHPSNGATLEWSTVPTCAEKAIANEGRHVAMPASLLVLVAPAFLP
jgi:hypothetical protein